MPFAPRVTVNVLPALLVADHLLALIEDRVADSRRNPAAVINVDCCRRVIDSATEIGQAVEEAFVNGGAANEQGNCLSRAAVVLQAVGVELRVER